MSEDDHDIIIRIDERTKNMLSVFDTHVKASDTEFKHVKKRVGFLEKGYWFGIGGLIVIQFMFQLWK